MRELACSGARAAQGAKALHRGRPHTHTHSGVHLLLRRETCGADAERRVGEADGVRGPAEEPSHRTQR